MLSPYTNRFSDITVFKAIATVITSSNFTFAQNEYYSGIYYIANGKSAIFHKHVVLDGSVFAEGDISFDGNNATITASGTNPALVAGGSLIINNAQNLVFSGTAFANERIEMDGHSLDATASPGDFFSLETNGSFVSSVRVLTAAGGIFAQTSIDFSQTQTCAVSGTQNAAALMAGTTLATSGGIFSTTGLIYAGGAMTLSLDQLTHTGILYAGGNLSVSGPLALVYDPALFFTPPPFVTGTLP